MDQTSSSHSPGREGERGRGGEKPLVNKNKNREDKNPFVMTVQVLYLFMSGCFVNISEKIQRLFGPWSTGISAGKKLC